MIAAAENCPDGQVITLYLGLSIHQMNKNSKQIRILIGTVSILDIHTRTHTHLNTNLHTHTHTHTHTKYAISRLLEQEQGF